MQKNPLFPSNDNHQPNNSGAQYGLPPNHAAGPIEPPKPPANNQDPAVSFIRQKVSDLYASEPSANQEIQEVETIKPQSKHQKFMYELNDSGKSLADIQVAWHNYYAALPEHEKHEVWTEFYELNSKTSHYAQAVGQQNRPAQPTTAAPKPAPLTQANHDIPNVFVSQEPLAEPSAAARNRRRKPSPIKNKLLDTKAKFSQVPKRRPGKIGLKDHLKSLAFGLSMGVIVLIIFLFSFFNQIIIAPFIQPSRTDTNTPLIVNAASISPTKTPEVIIPKINVEAPVDYNLKTDNENLIEDALENGVIHYASTVEPGQNGNVAIFGHSSNNIFNPGHYKFIFTLLHTLVPGDTFYLTYNGKVYVYQIFKRQIVSPSDVSILNQSYGKQATATLITCDPPGTSINRLAVTGVQISPNPSGNSAGTVPTLSAQNSAKTLAGNGPSLWSRFIHIF